MEGGHRRVGSRTQKLLPPGSEAAAGRERRSSAEGRWQGWQSNARALSVTELHANAVNMEHFTLCRLYLRDDATGDGATQPGGAATFQGTQAGQPNFKRSEGMFSDP